MNVNYLQSELTPVTNVKYTITTNANPNEWIYVDMNTDPPTYTNVDISATKFATPSDWNTDITSE